MKNLLSTIIVGEQARPDVVKSIKRIGKRMSSASRMKGRKSESIVFNFTRKV